MDPDFWTILVTESSENEALAKRGSKSNGARWVEYAPHIWDLERPMLKGELHPTSQSASPFRFYVGLV